MRNSRAIMEIDSGVENQYRRTEYPATDMKKWEYPTEIHDRGDVSPGKEEDRLFNKCY